MSHEPRILSASALPRDAPADASATFAAGAAALAALIGCDAGKLQRTLQAVRPGPEADAFGRRFARRCVLRADANATPLPNLLAAGGAARGVSGDGVAGYRSGNGLLSAIAGVRGIENEGCRP